MNWSPEVPRQQLKATEVLTQQKPTLTSGKDRLSIALYSMWRSGCDQCSTRVVKMQVIIQLAHQGDQANRKNQAPKTGHLVLQSLASKKED